MNNNSGHVSWIYWPMTVILHSKNFVCFTVIKYSVAYAEYFRRNGSPMANLTRGCNHNGSAQEPAADFSPRIRHAGAIFAARNAIVIRACFPIAIPDARRAGDGGYAK